MLVLTERQGRKFSDDSARLPGVSAVPKPGEPRIPWPAAGHCSATAAEGHAESKGTGFLHLALSFRILAAFPSLKRFKFTLPPPTHATAADVCLSSR